MMALHPQTVDLNLLSPKGEKLIAAGGKMDSRESNSKFGEETIGKAVDSAIEEVKHRLNNKDYYFNHGNSLAEGIWKKWHRITHKQRSHKNT